MGPDIQPEDIQELFNQLDTFNKEKEFSLISGSIPSTLPDTMYEQIIETSSGKENKSCCRCDKQPIIKSIKI